MIQFDPQTLYTMSDLENLLGDQASVRHFLDTTKPKRPFKKFIWGKHLIDALDTCERDVTGAIGRQCNYPPRIPKAEQVERAPEKNSTSGYTDSEIGVG